MRHRPAGADGIGMILGNREIVHLRCARYRTYPHHRRTHVIQRQHRLAGARSRVSHEWLAVVWIVSRVEVVIAARVLRCPGVREKYARRL